MAPDTEAKFIECFEELKKTVDSNPFHSNLAAARSTDCYRNIIELGKPVLPHLMQKLREGHFILNHAAAQITQTNIVGLSQANVPLSEQEISKLWTLWWDANKNEEEISAVIVPWALPKEHIPLYVFINKIVPISKIHICIPEHYDVVDTINILESSKANNVLTVNKIGHIPSARKDYFGIVIASNKIFEKLAIKTPVKIIASGEKQDYECTVFAKIFRPRLKISHIPSEMPIEDQSQTSLPINLKYDGFGDVSLRIEGTIDGGIVTEGGGSPIDTIVRGLMREGMLDSLLDDEFKEKIDGNIQVNREKLLSLLDEIKRNLKDEEFLSSLEKDKEIKQESIDWLKNLAHGEQEKFMSVFYDTVETYLIKKITDALYKNVTNKTHLEYGTKISTTIKASITKVNLKIFYADLNGNAYTPLETTVQIIDKRRSNSPVHVTLPIEIGQVDEANAYANVEEMQIGITD